MEAIRRMMSTENREGEIMGRVMVKNWRTLPAPSMLLASYRVLGMFCKPASRSTAS